jgi:protein TonB
VRHIVASRWLHYTSAPALIYISTFMIAAAAPSPFSSNRRVWTALIVSMAVHAAVLSGWHLRSFTPAKLAAMEPIEVTLVAETPRIERRAPPRVSPKPALAEKIPEAPPRPIEPTESAPSQSAQTSAPPVTQDAIVEARSDVASLNNPKPSYPPTAMRNRMEGTVLLSVYVRSDGTPGEVKLKQTSGHALLDNVVLETVRRYRFAPARRGNTPIDSTIEWAFSFRLEG